MSFAQLRLANIRRTRRLVRESVTPDVMIVQGSLTLGDIDKHLNGLVSRLREWFSFGAPELARSIKDPEDFAQGVVSTNRERWCAEQKIVEPMGGSVSSESGETLRAFAMRMLELFSLRDDIEECVIREFISVCPNLAALVPPLLGANLLSLAGGLRRLAFLPSSTIQVLGAEKALFRHLLSGAKSPKYGVLYAHPFVARSKNRGKAARQLADKISIAARVDFFKGAFVGDQLAKSLL